MLSGCYHGLTAIGRVSTKSPPQCWVAGAAAAAARSLMIHYNTSNNNNNKKMEFLHYPQQQEQQYRGFAAAAWDPRWRRVPPRAYKVARNRKKERKMEPIKKRLDKLRARERLKDRLLAENNLTTQSVADLRQSDKDLIQEVRLSDLRTFSACGASPFVYLANFLPNDSTTPKYLDRPSKYVRTKCQFQAFSQADFGNHHASWPETNVAEVAFMGRSNVGKSSLMNAIMHAKLARTSKLPGRTQHACYYGMFAGGGSTRTTTRTHDWRNACGFLVDLPGYGYAVGPDEAVDLWQYHTQKYLLARVRSMHLRRLYVLVDSRRVQQSIDWSILQWMDENAVDLPYSIVFTKADDLERGPQEIAPHLNTLSMRYNHLFRPQQPTMDDDEENGFKHTAIPSPRNEEDFLTRLGGQSPVFHITSASDHLGIEELWKSICNEFEKY